ncbi:hypothetical protein DV515_00001916 [Chloebia gouldiae]|uniref:Uncharacterized protein n=1 Tax=Chloebia gouldiae TaxID=44316 RepID=A0A3L8SWP9_CHLGU|nr:hypothetical protein DV515_00001916 [Chloebia gouldiae]
MCPSWGWRETGTGTDTRTRAPRPSSLLPPARGNAALQEVTPKFPVPKRRPQNPPAAPRFGLDGAGGKGVGSPADFGLSRATELSNFLFLEVAGEAEDDLRVQAQGSDLQEAGIFPRGVGGIGRFLKSHSLGFEISCSLSGGDVFVYTHRGGKNDKIANTSHPLKKKKGKKKKKSQARVSYSVICQDAPPG